MVIQKRIARHPSAHESSPTELAALIRGATGAREVALGPRIQRLWSGYGELRRVELMGAALPRAVVKHVTPPAARELAADPAALRSHRRKLRSYEVELAWYRRYAARCSADCRVPRPIHLSASDGRWLLLLEDLDASGFSGRRSRARPSELHACLRWLARFHATFLGQAPEGLWRVGCYWHLATRPDELAALTEPELCAAAPLIDAKLSSARYQTFVHGDAKLENFCFADDSGAVAALDFQYVGGGAGVKDVVYLLSSALTERELETLAERQLDVYFGELRVALELAGGAGDGPTPPEPQALEAEWRELYAYAWADFHRFLAGWAPAYAGPSSYGARVTRELLRSW